MDLSYASVAVTPRCPVHLKLVHGTLQCLNCQTMATGVEQQFKYTQPDICRNPLCNSRSRFMLDLNKSRLVKILINQNACLRFFRVVGKEKMHVVSRYER